MGVRPPLTPLYSGIVLSLARVSFLATPALTAGSALALPLVDVVSPDPDDDEEDRDFLFLDFLLLFSE